MYFPLFLDITKSKFLIIGAGNVALAKLETILEFGGDVKIISKDISAQTLDIVKSKHLEFINESYRKEHLQGADIIIAATNDKKTNHQISLDVKAENKLNDHNLGNCC